MIQIYHNSRCSKSRECLAFLQNSELQFVVNNYLQTPPTLEELKNIISKLNIKPIELVRQKEKIWIENYKNANLTDDAIIKAMVDYPVLIERPIVINKDKAVIARPLEKVNEIL
jgi:arsenate reductase